MRSQRIHPVILLGLFGFLILAGVSKLYGRLQVRSWVQSIGTEPLDSHLISQKQKNDFDALFHTVGTIDEAGNILHKGVMGLTDVRWCFDDYCPISGQLFSDTLTVYSIYISPDARWLVPTVQLSLCGVRIGDKTRLNIPEHCLGGRWKVHEDDGPDGKVVALRAEHQGYSVKPF
jgi:hypothetical protein